MPRKRLFLRFRHHVLGALTSDDKRLTFHDLSLRELSKESLLEKLRGFKAGGFSETFLVVPREEVLSQEFELFGPPPDLRKALSDKLEKSFPYRVEELSYGVRVIRQSGDKLKGALMAATNEKLGEFIRPIEEAGLALDDIVCTDETLLACHEKVHGPVSKKTLILDLNEHSLECVFADAGRIVYSKVFSLDTPDLLREVGLMTLQSEGLEAIYVSGRRDASFDSELQARFQVPIARTSVPPDSDGREVSASLYGAAALDGRKFPSLLPSDRKIRKKVRERNRAALAAAAALGAFLSACVLFFFVHGKALEGKRARLEKETASVEPEFRQVRRMHGLLKTAEKMDAANARTLSMLKELSLKIPSGVTLKKLRLGATDFLMQGESPDDSSIAGTLSLLKDLEGLDEPKLEYARSKPRAGERSGIFEFLITARRPDAGTD